MKGSRGRVRSRERRKKTWRMRKAREAGEE